MLRDLVLGLEALLLLLAAYNLLTALPAWRRSEPPPPPRALRPARVLVAAHDEERVIGGLLDDLAAQDHPAELVDVVVVADRCTDATAAVSAGRATVLERADGVPGKGPAIAWALTARPLEAHEVLIILDADNRVPADLVGQLVATVAAGAPAVQAYLDVTNPDGSPLATASALTYWAGNRMVQLARHRLGWSADLGGTGMAFDPTALAEAGGFTASLVEDQDLGVRLVLAGHAVHWRHDVRVRDEKPDDVAVAVRQRARWASGRRAVASAHLGALLRAAARTRTWGPVDVALRLVQPGRSFVALVTGLAAVVATVTASTWLLPASWWWAAVVAQFIAPVFFLRRDGVAARYLLRYPLVTVIAALWIPVQLVSAFTRGRWFHTPHGGTAPPPGSGS